MSRSPNAVPVSQYTPLLALTLGYACGLLNLHLITAAATRLTDRGESKPFVISSSLRVALFAIIAGVFAAVGPWWSSAIYLASLFLPFALHVFSMMRKGP